AASRTRSSRWVWSTPSPNRRCFETLSFPSPLERSTYLKGAAFRLAAVSIWAGWSVITRLAVTASLDAWDIAALRFGVAGLLLAPVVVWRGVAHDRLGWRGLAVIIVGQGAPYVLVAASGLQFAPARDQGALNPGSMPLFVTLVAATVLAEKIS